MMILNQFCYWVAVKTKLIPQRSEIFLSVRSQLQSYSENSTWFALISDCPLSPRCFTTSGVAGEILTKVRGAYAKLLSTSMMTTKAQISDFMWRPFQCSPEGSFFRLFCELCYRPIIKIMITFSGQSVSRPATWCLLPQKPSPQPWNFIGCSGASQRIS